MLLQTTRLRILWPGDDAWHNTCYCKDWCILLGRNLPSLFAGESTYGYLVWMKDDNAHSKWREIIWYSSDGYTLQAVHQFKIRCEEVYLTLMLGASCADIVE